MSRLGKWRLIIDEGPPEWCMAVDEAILIAKDYFKAPNTLRLFIFKPSSVTIGYFQKIHEAIDLNYLRKNRIPVVRRITGGGAVYHDEKGEVTYSIVAEIKGDLVDVEKSYMVICKGLIYALNELGLEAEFSPINDVIVNGKKISGSAQTRKKHALLQHGTLMYNTDLNVLARILRVPIEKLRAHEARSITERVTTVSRELGRSVSKEEVVGAMINGFKKALNIELEQGELSSEEVKLTEELREKYKSFEWNFKR